MGGIGYFCNMNKILALIAVFSIVGYSQAQKTIGLAHGTEETFYVDEDLPDGFKSCKIKFFNAGTSDVEIEYKQIELDFPDAWMISFCDNRDCLPNFPMTGMYAPIKPGDTTEMKLDVFPSGGADSALVRYAIWDKALPNLVDTLVYKIYARWGLNVQSLGSFSTRIYPNPSQGSDLNIAGNNIREVVIRAIDGRVVSKQLAFGENEIRLNMSHLTNGQYYIEVRTAEHTDTHLLQIAR